MCHICANFAPFDTSCPYTDAESTQGIDQSGSGTGGTAPLTPLVAAVDILEGGDAAGGVSTSYSVPAAGFFFGNLDSNTDSDWIAVDLVAGQTYTFAMVGNGALDEGVDDPELRLRDADGNQIASDDDSGPGATSSLTFTATSSGTYYIDAQSHLTSRGGDYVVSVTEGDLASFNVEMGAGALLRSDRSWASEAETPATVTWGIRDTGPATDASGNGAAFSQLSGSQAQTAQDIAAYVQGISGLTLQQVNPGGTTDNATILWGGYSSSRDGAGGYAYFPGSSSSNSVSGDIWLNQTQASTSSQPFGSYTYYLMLHELGHALGLSHPGDYNVTPGQSITYANSAQFIQDSQQYTVMSYFSEASTTTGVPGFPDTLLLYDIYALHQLYGADYSFNAEDTIYGFNATAVGSAYDFVANNRPLLSIWDGAGEDTLDVSGFSQNQVISLVDGTFSDVGGYVGNVSIAVNAEIENAVGGAGNDAIVGNALDNDLNGNDGNDLLSGGDGNDTFTGGFGDDTIEGGDGNDVATGGNDDDLIFGHDGDDDLNGQQQNDTIDGGFGNDTIFGGLGDDSLIGAEGHDSIDGFADDDYITGGWGDDTVRGNTGSDTVYGDFGQDSVFGGNDNDFLYGGGGFDTIYGGFGDDEIWGDDQADRIFGNWDNDTLWGGQGFDTLNGGFGDDELHGGTEGDQLFGFVGEDTIYGDTGNDTLHGGDDNDVLDGGVGSDRLTGGLGDDLMTGGAGNDLFRFSDGHGADTITDFNTGSAAEDIDFSLLSTINNFAQVQAAATDVAGGVLIDTGGGNSILLSGLTEAQLDASDFLF